MTPETVPPTEPDDPCATAARIGIPYEPPRKGIDCTKRTPPERHDMPDEWDYRFCPEGQMTCRKCGVTWYD